MRARRSRVVGVLGVLILLVAATVSLIVRSTGPEPNGCGDTGPDRRASGPEPALVVAVHGVVAREKHVPLVVADRLLVFAVAGRVWSTPLASGCQDAYWSLTRSGQTITGVVADDSAPATVVVAWSDGRLDGIDAATGAIRWHADDAADPAARPDSPSWPIDPDRSLFLLQTATADVALVAQAARLTGFAVGDGRRLWTHDLGGPHCAGPGFTTENRIDGGPTTMSYVYQNLCGYDAPVVDAATGTEVGNVDQLGDPRATGWKVVPDGCRTRNVGCDVFAWYEPNGYIGAILQPPFGQAVTQKYNPPPPFIGYYNTWKVDLSGTPNVVVTDGALTEREINAAGIKTWGLPASYGAHPLWTDPTSSAYLAGSPTRLYEVTTDSFMIVDPQTGVVTSRTPIAVTGVADVYSYDSVAVVAASDGTAVIVGTPNTA
jgi:hypothetical protein